MWIKYIEPKNNKTNLVNTDTGNYFSVEEYVPVDVAQETCYYLVFVASHSKAHCLFSSPDLEEALQRLEYYERALTKSESATTVTKLLS